MKVKKSTPIESAPASFAIANEQLWAGGYGTIDVFNALDLSHVRTLSGHSSIVNALEVVGTAVWSCSSDKEIRVWDLDVRTVLVYPAGAFLTGYRREIV